MNRQNLSTIIFFGAIWGLLEATLGYLLQFLPPLVSGSIMFPIGATLLIYTYKNTTHKSSVIYVALIAASIKAVNFFMPGLMPIKTYNPMIAIMLQSFAVISILNLFDHRSHAVKILGLGLASFLWRGLFLMNISINHALTGFKFQQLVSIQASLNFVLLYGLMGALFLGLLFGLTQIIHKDMKLSFRPSYLVATTLLIIAMIATFII